MNTLEQKKLIAWNNHSSVANEFVGFKYKCVFDENKGVYDTSQPHTHLIKESRYIHMPRYIFDGYAFDLEGKGITFTGITDKNLLLQVIE